MPSKKLIIEQTNGETYDITVYDTKEECPEPNMYVTFAAENGVSEEGWIKLGEETDYGATQAIKQRSSRVITRRFMYGLLRKMGELTIQKRLW